MESHASVVSQKYSRDISQAAKVQANHISQKIHFFHPSELFKLTKILPPGGFGAVVANVNKKAPGGNGDGAV